MDVFTFLSTRLSCTCSWCPFLSSCPCTSDSLRVLHCAGARAGALAVHNSLSVHFKAVVVCFISLPLPELFSQRNSWDGTKVHLQQSGTGCGGLGEQEGEIMLGWGIGWVGGWVGGLNCSEKTSSKQYVLKEKEWSGQRVDDCESKMRRSCLEAARTGFSQTSMKTASSSHSWLTGRGQHEGRRGRYQNTRDVCVRKRTPHAQSWKNGTDGEQPPVRKITIVWRVVTNDWVRVGKRSLQHHSPPEPSRKKTNTPPCCCSSCCCCCLSWLGSLFATLWWVIGSGIKQPRQKKRVLSPWRIWPSCLSRSSF